MFGFKKRRREKLRAEAVPPSWREIVARNVEFWPWLGEADQRELLAHVQVFLAEKRFEAAGAIEISEEMRVTIAANACLLLLHRETDYFPMMSTVVVRDQPFVAPQQIELDGGGVLESEDELSGEAWYRGPVVLSWADIVEDMQSRDGCNVILHEFAHAIDAESGAVDGTPPLASRDAIREWKRVFAAAYARHCEAIDAGRETVIDDYGAECPEEFFATATEAFFLSGNSLRADDPALYAQFAAFFRQDSASINDDK
ncbi:MAG: zinc-dependent peptidase [Phycisphaerae bacterium]